MADAVTDGPLPDGRAPRRRRSGIPTGNAGEYFVMGELLRRGFDAQLADRNTQGYDIVFGDPSQPMMHKLQVKSVRAAPWYVRSGDFVGAAADQITIYVLVGGPDAARPIRYFIARNADLAPHLHQPAGWTNGFMPLRALQAFEDNWAALRQRLQRQTTLAPADTAS